MFWIVILLLSVTASLFVMLPLFFGRATQSETDERQQINLSLYRERIEELESLEDAEALTLEARKDLLRDASGEVDVSPVVTQASTNSKWMIVAALVVPVLAVLFYADFGLGRGAITDLHIAEKLRVTDPSDRAGYREVAIQLERRANRTPDNNDTWFLLARVYSNLGEFAKAASIYGSLLSKFPEDANLSSYYAETLFVADDRRLTPRVDAALDRALELNPHDLTMLEIKGIAAIGMGDTAAALNWFQRALATGASGQRAELIRMAISRLQAPANEAPGSVSGSAGKPESSVQRTISVKVAAGDNVDLPPETIVFVFARAVQGPPAPLAVQKLTLDGLPVVVTLDESMAMMPGMGLANFDKVQIIARISASGGVTLSSGDYEAKSEEIDLTDEITEISLVIRDQVE
jgi:cytochrome c-type biogenesis protein CcmH